MNPDKMLAFGEGVDAFGSLKVTVGDTKGLEESMTAAVQ
jgi:hypothetical protein